MTIDYNKTGEERKALVRDIESLTGIKAVYMKMPTQAYEIGPYTVSNTGAFSFPWWHNDVGADEVHAFTNFICKLKETAGNQKRVTSKETAPDNEKYAFRCFLLKLGFIGDEYKRFRQKSKPS